jgi:hypothetical protein
VSESSPAPVSIPLQQETIDRLQAAAAMLKLSVGAALSGSVEQVATALIKGWRPTQLPPAGPVYLAFRPSSEMREEVASAAKAAGIKPVDVNRLTVWAALYKMEGNKQVLWPFRFTRKELNSIVQLYADPAI